MAVLSNKTLFINVLIRKCECHDLYTAHNFMLTHWGRVTHICVGKLTSIGLKNGLSPDRRQAIIWTNDGILFIGPLGTNFSDILIEIPTFSFTKMRLKVSVAKRQPFCIGLNMLRAVIEACLNAITKAFSPQRLLVPSISMLRKSLNVPTGNIKVSLDLFSIHCLGPHKDL